MRPIITLITDFEERDPQVAMVKGTICSLSEEARIVDLSHSLPRAEITEAALYVTAAVRHFPKGTIHLVSVAGAADPLAVQVSDQIVLCPDNGVLTVLEYSEKVQSVRRISNPSIIKAASGQVYLAKDVLAPAAAYLANGGDIAGIGEEATDFKRIDLKLPKIEAKRITGEVILIDHFGNLITNVDKTMFGDAHVTAIEVAGFPVGGIRNGFNEVEVGSPLAILNSGGLIQISYRGDRADQRLGAQIGNKVQVNLR